MPWKMLGWIPQANLVCVRCKPYISLTSYWSTGHWSTGSHQETLTTVPWTPETASCDTATHTQMLFPLHFHHTEFSNSSSKGLHGLMQISGWCTCSRGSGGGGQSHRRAERGVWAQLRIGAGQWWKVHMLQCHHKLYWKEWSGHKGVPKIGWNCSQSENKLLKFQYEQIVFLTCIFMWSLLGEARSTEMKYNMLWHWNWKLLFHLDTKMQRNLHESGASRPKDLLWGKDKMNDGVSVGLNSGSKPVFSGNRNLRSLTFSSYRRSNPELCNDWFI